MATSVIISCLIVWHIYYIYVYIFPYFMLLVGKKYFKDLQDSSADKGAGQ